MSPGNKICKHQIVIAFLEKELIMKLASFFGGGKVTNSKETATCSANNFTENETG